MPIRVGNKEVVGMKRGGVDVPSFYRANFRAFISSTPPVITEQPVGLTVVSGNVANFTASAEGKPDPSVQWQVSNNGGITWSNIGDAINTTYSFVTSSTNHNYQYRAIFTNTAGTAITNPVVLDVQTVPVITSHPQSETVNAGQIVTFSASSSGNPSPSIQWQFSSNSGSTWSNIAGATSATYSFTTSSVNNNYRYRAVFTNAIGTAITNSAILSVQYAPIVTSHPQSTTVIEPATATFNASINGNPAPSIQWQISTNSGSTWNNISGATGATYSFTSSLASSGNRYRAVASNVLGSVTTSAGTLTVLSKPVFTTQPYSRRLVYVTGTVDAVATGSPSPSYKWQVSYNKGASWQDAFGSGYNTSSYPLINAEGELQYRCIATNSAGSTISQVAKVVKHSFVQFNGGVISTAWENNTYWRIHKFTNVGNNTLTLFLADENLGLFNNEIVEYLVVGGGGGSGQAKNPLTWTDGGGTFCDTSPCTSPGGGGAGGFRTGWLNISGNTDVIVGNGGVHNENGSNSQFGTIVSAGGGAGGDSDNRYGHAGGSGGGGGVVCSGSNRKTRGVGNYPATSPAQGYNGADSSYCNNPGGGGGAGGPGIYNSYSQGGGPARSSSITGTAVNYGRGGSGGSSGGPVANTGNGGNGRYHSRAYLGQISGSTGIVIVRYPYPPP